MKKLFTVIAAVIMAVGIFAQSPQKMSYQAVVRNASGILVTNQSVGLKISILQGTSTGTIVFQETYNPNPQTNANGLLTFEIGSGTPSIGTFASINWSNGPYFIMTETDPSGGTNYTITGTSQLLSVPYAMYAANSGGLNYSSAPLKGDILFYNNSKWNLLSKGTEGQVLKVVSELPAWFPADLPVLPVATTKTVSEITQTTAVCGGLAMANGNTEIIIRGVCWSTNQNPTVSNSKTQDGAGLGDFTSAIAGLTPGTTYYVRAYATNSSGTSYGNQVSFKSVLTVIFPTVTTAAAISITESSAASGGNVTATGGAVIIARGVCWSTNQNPTVADIKTVNGAESGQFESQLNNLNPGTIYYVRAYATNSAGTGYGAQVTCPTLKTIPTIFTKNISSISPMGGVSGGTITLSGGGTISDKGICWSESENPTIIDNNISAGTGTATFNSAIGLLKPNSTCYVRAYAVNEIGIAYGAQKTFTTLDAFYDGFETGFSGNTGGWGIVTPSTIEGGYCLKTSRNGAIATLTRTLANPGQITFYARQDDNRTNITFYIDNELQGTYPNTFWGLQSFPVTTGEHTFKWQLNSGFDSLNGYIDFIVMPK
jgi:hypothetical protein